MTTARPIAPYLSAVAAVVTVGAVVLAVLLRRDSAVDFNAEIRPILNKKCLACHGGVRQRSELSFLFREDALLPAKSGLRAIVPGDASASELIKRINHPDPDERMPPDEPALTREERETIATWIDQGARWETHWAYRPLSRRTDAGGDARGGSAMDGQMTIASGGWARNGIDSFVLKTLRSKNLHPSEEASRTTLARRLSLDLIGLPPTVESASSFLADTSALAYESFVDELLASPHFGERWASVWLDLARYADSQGYQKDLIRPEIWRYRDWVIDAFNRDLPFDQFTVEQLAGDLLPNPTENQLLATAFHRNTLTNDEGGTDDEEFRIAAVIDRLNTTFEVWQGTTIACVQCHHHPYDPIRHREFYELAAFFNTTADRDYNDDRPLATLYSPAQAADRRRIREWLDERTAEADTNGTEYADQLRAYLQIQPGRVPIMRELHADSTRQTRVFEKGNWLVHGEAVVADVPDFLPPLPEAYPRDRLGLARWLVDGENPLTPRVTVNRFWQQMFGRGLVSTLEDFGTQGQAPTHPELLDWLASRFVHDHGWSVKALLKEMVMSATYRQSSIETAELVEADPDNRFLSRSSRYRLSAEQIRDQALAVSGLLNRTVYGRSTMPYQPPGVWNVIRHAAQWQSDSTSQGHRRALYTFWRRVSPYPSMMSFDAPSREVCVSRRIRTNTPLQALITLNDPVYVEAATALARSMQLEGGDSVEDRITFGFRLALVREPDTKRLETLVDLYTDVVEHYALDAAAARQLAPGGTDDPAELAALINVASVLLNLDEMIMRS